MTPAEPSTATGGERSLTLPVGTRVGEFEVVGVIGEGNFGIVYVVQDHQLQRRLAVKEYVPATLVIRAADCTLEARSPMAGATFRAGLHSFLDEAKLLSAFEHPALLKVLSYWEQSGTAYMAMPHYDGKTLKTLVSEGLRPDEAWLRSFLEPLLAALDMLHGAQCFHRDITPANVMVLNNGAPLLMEFGAARRTIASLTQDVTVVLKPGYAPLEQYTDDPSLQRGAWSDIYSLAAVLRFAITGKPPTTPVMRALSDTMKPLRGMVPGYSEEFLRGIDEALAVRPDERPHNVPEFRLRLGMPPSRPSSNVQAFVPDTERSHEAGAAEKPHESQEEPAPAPPQSPSATVDLDSTLLFDGAQLKAHLQQHQSGGGVAPGPGAPSVRTPGEPDVRDPGIAAENGPARSRLWKIIVAALLTIALIITGALHFRESNQASGHAAAGDKDPSGSKAIAPKPVAPPAPASNPPISANAREPGQSASQAANGAAVELQAAPARANASAVASVPATHAEDPVTIAPRAESAPSPTKDTTSARNAPPARAEALAAAPVVPRIETGKLRLNILPWGEVYVDGRYRQPSPPLKELNLPKGRHSVEVRNGAFPAFITEVVVQPGARVDVSHTFK
ncbi:MAG: serine/threonine protein kinase [Pseudomonadota bacterium]|nr:serine/threonine protein kinase [Pseudomonadota bacterium]